MEIPTLSVQAKIFVKLESYYGDIYGFVDLPICPALDSSFAIAVTICNANICLGQNTTFRKYEN